MDAIITLVKPNHTKFIYVHRIALICVATFLQACIPVKVVYYLPTDEQYSDEGRWCGYPFGSYSNALAPGVVIAINGTLSEGNLWLNFQFIIDKNRSLRFSNNTVTLFGNDGDVREAILSASSGGRYPSLDPTQRMQGSPPELLVANVLIPDFEPDLFTLRLPTVEVNDKDMVVKPIVFARQERRGVTTCIQ